MTSRTPNRLVVREGPGKWRVYDISGYDPKVHDWHRLPVTGEARNRKAAMTLAKQQEAELAALAAQRKPR